MGDGYRVAKTSGLTCDMLARPEVVALFGFAGAAKVAQLLTDGVLHAGGAALVARYTGGESLRNPSIPGLFMCVPATPTKPSTWRRRCRRWA